MGKNKVLSKKIGKYAKKAYFCKDIASNALAVTLISNI